MKRIPKTTGKNTLTIALVFCIFVGGLVLVSILFKIVSLIGQSAFDGQHRFTILVSPQVKTLSGVKSQILSFAPDTNSISILTIFHKPSSFQEKAIKESLKVPIDASVYPTISVSDSDTLEYIPLLSQREGIESVLWFFLTHAGSTKNLTVIDVFRLWLFTKTVPAHAIVIREVNLTAKHTSIEESTLSQVVSKLFVDFSLSQEKKSIQIINGTGIVGLGSKVAQIVTNMGGNVVDVSTADSLLSQSEIAYYGDSTYTSSKLSKLFGIKRVSMQKEGISDIIIKIGKDKGSQLNY